VIPNNYGSSGNPGIHSADIKKRYEGWASRQRIFGLGFALEKAALFKGSVSFIIVFVI
jgi:hypothetical protein